MGDVMSSGQSATNSPSVPKGYDPRSDPKARHFINGKEVKTIRNVYEKNARAEHEACVEEYVHYCLSESYHSQRREACELGAELYCSTH